MYFIENEEFIGYVIPIRNGDIFHRHSHLLLYYPILHLFIDSQYFVHISICIFLDPMEILNNYILVMELQQRTEFNKMGMINNAEIFQLKE